MQHFPFFIPSAFILTTLLTLILLSRALVNFKNSIWPLLGWLILTAMLALTGFFLKTDGVPPHFALLILPPLLLIFIIVFTGAGRFDAKKLALLHVVRIPVELVLYALYVYHAVPRLMTFEGGNLDILSGLSAPFIYYFGFVKPRINRGWLIAWNIFCLLLLINIVVRAILSAPFAFQQFGFEQPNIALLYFPYCWLPGFVVPAVLFAHLITLRQLIIKNK